MYPPLSLYISKPILILYHRPYRVILTLELSPVVSVRNLNQLHNLPVSKRYIFLELRFYFGQLVLEYCFSGKKRFFFFKNFQEFDLVYGLAKSDGFIGNG